MSGSDWLWGGRLNQSDSCTEVHRGGDKNQDFMIIRLVNANDANDLIGHGGET